MVRHPVVEQAAAAVSCTNTQECLRESPRYYQIVTGDCAIRKVLSLNDSSPSRSASHEFAVALLSLSRGYPCPPKVLHNPAPHLDDSWSQATSRGASTASQLARRRSWANSMRKPKSMAQLETLLQLAYLLPEATCVSQDKE